MLKYCVFICNFFFPTEDDEDINDFDAREDNQHIRK